jgi:FAD/FMN-containing dehydrogenase
MAEQSWFASSDRERERFRRFRHSLPEAVNNTVRRRGLMKMGSDYAVPFARNKEMMAVYRERLENEFPGQYVIFGHIGDAHVHVNILPGDGAESERAGKLMVEFARAAVAFGGTVGAEHGLGKRKAHLLAIQYSPAEIEAMKAVKRRLDPNWLLGQGTLFTNV